MRGLCFLFFGIVLASAATADRSVWLKNTDSKLFVYWAISGPADVSVLGRLSLVPRHLVGPGERVSVTVGGGTTLVGVFVPWAESPTLRTKLEGGLLLESELPPQGTLLLDSRAFQAANHGRSIAATLQEWGLEVPHFVLDGRAPKWSTVPLLMEWGPVFAPPEGWPLGWPRPRTLQAVDREGALWLRLTMETAAAPAGTQASLVLRRPGAFLEWPLSGSPTVWLWDDAGNAKAVGMRVVAPGVMEGWVPWDRWSSAEKTAWSRSPLTVEWLTSEPRTYSLGSLRWEDLP